MKTRLDALDTVEMVPATNISNSCQIELPEKRFVVTYGATNGFVKIGKIVDGVTTFGSSVDFSSVPINFSSVAKIDYDSLCIAYSTSTAGGRVRLGIVDDLEIDEFVENAQFSTSNGTNHIEIVALDTFKVLIAYNDNVSGTGKAVIGTIDEDTITFGSTYTFYNTGVSSIRALKITNNNKVCISFESNGGHTVLGEITGNVISFHSSQQFNSTTTYSPNIALLTNGQICLAYSDPFPSSHIEIMLGDIGTSTITWYPEKVIFDGSDVTGMQLQSFPNNRVTLAIADDAGVHYGSIMLLHRGADGVLVEDDVEVVHSDELYGISAVNVENRYCNVVYSGYITQFTGKSSAFEIKVLEELSSIYGTSNKKENIRGKAAEGFIRPTIKQFFTSTDYEEINSDMYIQNGTNPVYSNLNKTDTHICCGGYSSGTLISNATSSYPDSIPKGFEMGRINFNGGTGTKMETYNEGYGVKGVGGGYIGMWMAPNALTGDQLYYEFTVTGDRLRSVGVCTSNNPYLNTGNAHANYFSVNTGWAYRKNAGEFIHNNVWDGTPTGSDNCIVGIAIDLVAGDIWWSRNGVWQSSNNGTPSFTF